MNSRNNIAIIGQCFASTIILCYMLRFLQVKILVRIKNDFCKDSSGTIINDIHLLKLCYAIDCFDSRTRSSMAQCAISLTATYTRLPCSQWRLAANNRHRSVLAPMAPLAAWRLLTFVQGDRLQRQPITDMAAYSALRC